MSQAVVSVNAGLLLPVLAPAAGAAIILVTDVVVQHLRRTHYVIALLSLLVGAAATVAGLGLGRVAGEARRTLCLPDGGQCMYVADSVTSTLQLAALLTAALTLLLSWPDDKLESPGGTAVIVSLVLAATAGATAVAGARDLGTWLVALELATLPTVALVALRGARSAISGAVALLTAALVSFGLLALAAGLWYTATGSGFLTPVAALAMVGDPTRRPILVLAVVVAIAGIGFKLSLVPFHAWTPEAYDGAPLPIAAFLAGETAGLLSADTLDEMRSPIALDDRSGEAWTGAYGLGCQLWNLDGTRYAGHGGSMPGFLAGVRVNVETGDGVVVFANATSGLGPLIVSDLLAILADREPVAPRPWSADPDQGRVLELAGERVDEPFDHWN